MINVFEAVLRMSAAATLVVLALLIFRPLLKKLSGGLRTLLWLMVAVRLLCPVMIESRYSLVPSFIAVSSAEAAPSVDDSPVMSPPITEQAPLPVTKPNVPPVTEIEKPTVEIEKPVLQTEKPVTEGEKTSPLAIGAIIWFSGAVAMLFYFAVSYLRLKRRLSISIKKEDRIYICDGISTPFIMGVLSTRIYLPSYMEDEYVDVIVSHEREHIAKGDHLKKMFGYLLLSLHWFNPFVWCAYWLFCKDIELACDERVIKSRDEDYKKLYASALLYCCSRKGGLSPCRVSFGEINVKQRILKVLKYKKTSVCIVIACFIIVGVIALMLLTNPKASSGKERANDDGNTEDAVTESTEESSETVGNASEENYGEPTVSHEAEDTSEQPDLSQEIPQEEITEEISEEVNLPPTVSEEDTDTSEQPNLPEALPEDNGSNLDVFQERMSLQSQHVTAEGINPENDCTKSRNDGKTPIYVSVYDEEKNLRTTGTGRIYEQGLIVWLCDVRGEKIDYVYTNSSGIARFEVYEGTYTLLFEGSEQYVPATTEAFTVNTPMIYHLSNPIRVSIVTYKSSTFKPCTVTVLDADTGKGISGAHIIGYEYVDAGFYTDAQGVATISPLIEFNHIGETYCGLDVTCNGYASQRINVDIYKSNVTVTLSKIKDHPYTVRVIDADTGEGVEGVQLIMSDPSDTSRIYTATSGKDGVVSGMKNSNQLATYPQINLYYSAENIPYAERTYRGEGKYVRFSITLTEGENNYVVKLKTSSDGKTLTMSR